MQAALQIPLVFSLLIPAIHGAVPIFSTILGASGQEYATSVTSDPQGNVYVVGRTYSPDFPVTRGAFQTQFGGTCDAFVAKVGPDGKLVWATYLGGILDDGATGVALDGAGNVLVTGRTGSANFPLLNPIQGTIGNGVGDAPDAFVAKLDPTGAKLLYSTLLGGQRDDSAAGIAVDSAGNAYVAVSSDSATGFPGTQNAPDQAGIVVTKLTPQGTLVFSYFHPDGTAGGIALDAAGAVYVTGSSSATTASNATNTFGPPGSAHAIVFKISPDGMRKIYETALGGSVQANGAAIAVDSAGEAYVAGNTYSVDFPLVHPLQNSLGARPLWKSTDSGGTWMPIDNLPFALPTTLVIDPTAPNMLYESTGDLGIFKSLDGGVNWMPANSGIAGTNIQTLAIDPVHPRTLYAATASPINGPASSAVYKSVDGADHWTLIDSPALAISQLAVDAQNPNIIWEVSPLLRKSVDAGVTWKPVTFPGFVQSFALDPRISGHVFAGSTLVFCGFGCTSGQNPYLYSSVDGGATWMLIPAIEPATPVIVDPSTNPSTVYNGLSSRSVDGGITWAPINPPQGVTNSSVYTLAVDPGGTLYAAILGQGIYVSHDRAQTWSSVGSMIPPPSVAALSPKVNSLIAGSSGTLYASTSRVASSGFVTKLSSDGSTLIYSTYLRGHASLEPFVSFAAEPDVFTTENWISAIVLDSAGSATVAGGTHAVDFPALRPAQARNAGFADAFAATLSPDGGKLNFSTYFGGSQDDGALGAALDSQGNLIFAGQTWSSDFPNPGGSKPFSYGDAFVVKLAAPGPPVITAVLNGASYLPGIESGSWVMIQGTNLANTYPGRTWTASELVNGSLPTSLDGVSVTINGNPAFVYYISPTQINVQAPSDSFVGPVSVVVTNNGEDSAPATAQLQSAAPAFFTYLGTNYAIASRLPDYALLGDPSAVQGTVPAKPGDIVTLWGTGFGATNPAVQAGTAVSGVPAVATLPIVTVGGAAAQVINTVLSPGSAGLYQVTIQIPATIPAGPVSVSASIGGVQTQPGAILFVSSP